MSENQIPAPIIANSNNANETQRIVMIHPTQQQIPQLKPKVYATIDDAVNAGATQIVINKRGVIYQFTPEQWQQVQQRRAILRQADDDQRRNEREITHPLPPRDDAHQENVRLRNELADAVKSKNMWMGLARRMGQLRTQDRSETDEANKRRDDLQAARDTWIQKANENAKKVADLEKEITKLQKSNDYWQAQADKWHKQNDASVDTIQELKKENQEIKSKLKTEANKVQTLTSTMLMFRRKIDIALGEESK